MRQLRVIFQNHHYQAAVLRGESLIVSRQGKQGGKHLVGAAAREWIDAIETAIDRDEASALCRAILA